MARIGLSKSKILSGLQCQKRLFLEIHQPQLAEVDDSTEQRFADGHHVGAIAHSLFPGGKLIEAVDDLDAALDLTHEAMQTPGSTALFEPAFTHDGVLVRADVVTRRRGKTRAIEVKSSTRVKPYHLSDAAVQYWVMEGAGYPASSISIAHINNSFVYKGEGNYAGLFTVVDVTQGVLPLVEQVPIWIAAFRKMLGGEVPYAEMGGHCNDPFPCPFQSHCGSDQPEYPVSILPYGEKLVAQLHEEGNTDLRDVPGSRILNDTHVRVWRVSKSGKAEIGDEGRKLIRGLAYPRYYLDFETIQFAVPVWAGTRPYEQLPFQWSCHVERGGGVLEHCEFLDTSSAPPMRAFADSLIAALAKRGPILVYSHFERTTLNALAARYPDLKTAIARIIGRLVDLRPIARANYYHPDMKGSWSIKSVLPTIAPELSYENLGEVQDGGGAQVTYLEIIDPVTDGKRSDGLIADLKAYCRQDTLALVRLARCFQESKTKSRNKASEAGKK